MSGENKSRMRVMGGNVVISVVGAAAILIMVNYLGARHYSRMDWTSSQIYTLSGKTTQVVKNVKKPVTLFVLWSRTDPMFGHMEEVLKGYKSLSENIKVEVLDPDEDPEQFAFMQDKYGKVKVNEMGQAGIEAGVFVVCGDNVKFLAADSFQDFGDEPGMPGGNQKMSFKAESQITSAIINVSSSEKQTICFTQGHGEWKFEGGDRDSLRHIKKELSLDGYDSLGFSIIDEGGVPKECNAVVVAGPHNAFMEREATLLGKFFNKGGNVALFLDPIFKNEVFRPSGLEKFTARNGIELRNDFILETDPRRLVSETPVTFIADNFFNHAAVKPLYSDTSGPMPVVFSIVRSLGQVEGEDVVSDILGGTSAMSWGEVDLASIEGGNAVPTQDQFDAEGPLAIAMAAIRGTTDGREAGRMVVVGDSDFLSEELFINASLYNQDFWSSLVGWLTLRKDMVSIAPKNPEQVQLVLSDDDFINLVVTLLMELFLILIIGVMVIYRRRK